MTQRPIDVPDARGTDGPKSELDFYQQLVQPSTSDQFLKENNLGTGYYSKKELWQQVDSFADGIWAREAFRDPLLEHAIEETKFELGMEAWDGLDDEERDGKDRQTFVKKVGRGRWAELVDQDEHESRETGMGTARRQLTALREYAGYTGDWMPPHLRMVSAIHDASKSREARLMDNLTGRVSVNEIKDDAGEDSKRRLMAFNKRR